ncbi:ABC transporter permease [Xylanibacter muris]|uniref:ABC transporter permease n=1 Tax=Xylanibacter muris TaxID=2736290 RepID=UPI0025A1E14B|nr:ABC transporter permease [Xylanibacter muris]
MKCQGVTGRLKAIFRRELGIFSRRPMFLFCMIVLPVFCVVFFTSLLGGGLPTELPTGLVDEDDTQTTRTIARTLDAFQTTDFVESYPSFSEARQAMQRREIYGFFYIPKGTTEEAIANKQPRISFYTNEPYYVAGTLLMRDMLTAANMASLAMTRETLYAKGFTEDEAMAAIQPIVIEAHPLKNPTLDYSVYLSNIVLPGILILLILLTTTYTIGLEWKQGTQRQWYRMAGGSVTTALAGKLLPQTVIFSLIIIFYDVYLYRFMAFPCNSGIAAMMGVGILTVLASQAFGVFLSGIFSGQMRMAMCLSSLWGILSFSLAGFTFPTSAMSPVLSSLAALFPLRHYYLLYANQALNGYPIAYAWTSVVALLLFIMLPLTVNSRYRAAFLKYRYKP